MEPPARFTLIPPEKSPPPHKIAAASASSAFPCTSIRLPRHRCSHRRLSVLCRRPVTLLRDHLQIRPQHLYLNIPVLAVNKRFTSVIANRVLVANLCGNLRKALFNPGLPELSIEVPACRICIRRQNVVPHHQRQVHPVQESYNRQRRIPHQRSKHSNF